MTTELRVRRGGEGEPLLLLLHGLGATGGVWAGWPERWAGRWVAPDLPGHGGSARLISYGFDALAASVLHLLEPDVRTIVVGHSLGGVVALALAARAPVTAVVGIGIKVAWSEEDLQRAKALSERPVTWFDSRESAIARHLKVSGLTDPDSPAARNGVVEEDGRWRLALDPRAFGVGAPDMRGLIAASRAPVTLARGSNDPMNTDEQLAQFGVPVVTLPGLGHNAHVESPSRCLTLVEP